MGGNRDAVVPPHITTKMDRPGADFARCVEQVQSILKAHPIPIQLPIGAGYEFEAVIDLIEMPTIYFSKEDQGATVLYQEIPEEMAERAAEAREEMIELVADVDDDIASLYLEGEEAQAVLDEMARGGSVDIDLPPDQQHEVFGEEVAWGGFVLAVIQS